jgi:exodeoxyribonuclease V beta subunit
MSDSTRTDAIETGAALAEVLDPLTLPLRGSRLIEASAGTGKTWTIAALFVRLVLGHGAPGQGFGRPLLPGEILVMTFTKAATRELSDRIRHRLVEAAACFRGQADAPPDDFLAALLAGHAPGPARQQAAWRLAMAAEAMDDAAVHTIDAWCQRMLREHAFDSGCLFDEELQPGEAVLLAEAVRDYWRQQVYPLGDEALATVLGQWKDLAALASDMAALLGKPLPAGAGQGSLLDAATRAAQERGEALAALKAGWAQRADEMLDWLTAQWQRSDCPIDKKKLGEANGRKWLRALRAWASSTADEPPQLGAAEQRLTPQGVHDACKPGMATVTPAVFAAFEALMAALKTLPEPGRALRLHAAARVAERMQQMKRQAGQFGFADMLDRLDAALDEAGQGAKARRLRQRIVDQYPVALIDEFQDTSPVQLSIFDRLYRIGDNDPGRALLLIGDPKQAIYGFRGADIYSYLRARRATQGRHHVLGTNHRSSAALVAAVNQLFGAAEARAGEGAFMFRGAATGAGVGESALPFVAVRAHGRAERFVTAQGEVPAITAVVDTELRNAAGSRELFAELCAERIVGLLNDAAAGFAADGPVPHAPRSPRPLRPADMAVLVRSGTEADAVRQALRRRGLASVYLSDKDTVFQTDEAADLLRLLQAVAAPREVRLARAAFATALRGLRLDELVALATDDEDFDRQCELLQQLNGAWKQQGVLAMLRRGLHLFGLPARWLAGAANDGSGERRLTNLLHLAELLQAASAQLDGEQALIRWLAQQIDDGGAGLNGGDELVLRLESDADLVKVVTVHKSKGLEYPLVFLPFAAHFREVDGDTGAVLALPAAEGGTALVLSPSKAQVALAEKERQREGLRLLYVALTRARHALWLGVSGLQVGRGKDYTWHRSAIGYLLSGAAPQPPEQRVADVLAFARACPQVAVETWPAADVAPAHAACTTDPADPGVGVTPVPAVTRVRPRQALPRLEAPPAYAARFDRVWAISSYSALVRDAAWGPAASGQVPVRVLRADEPDDGPADAAGTGTAGPSAALSAVSAALSASPQAGRPWHRFPRGAFAGNFLHDQLEWLAGEGFALDGSAALQQALLRRCERQGWGHRADEVLAWLRQVCSTPLPPLGAPLAALGSLRPEMEFWFPSDGLQAGMVDRLCRQHLQPGQPRPALPERALKGMLMGFADLVFEHAGRYWVLDYKSNALGTRDGDYTPAAMAAAMLEHRYDVQAALYLLALHRLLRARLGVAYAPAQQLGGALYYFLRGIQGPAAGCCHVAPPLALLDALDLMLRSGAVAGAAEAAEAAGAGSAGAAT